MLSILTIDFEASCLPSHGRSFPIEVGIADQNGWSRAWLIRPHDGWSHWCWTAEAEQLHGLTRTRIETEGSSVDQVLAELIQALRGRRLIADSHLDDDWLKTLCHAARAAIPFRIGHICELMDVLGASSEEIVLATAAADRDVRDRHRARLDALWLAKVADRLIAAAERRSDHARPLFDWDRGAEAFPGWLRAAA